MKYRYYISYWYTKKKTMADSFPNIPFGMHGTVLDCGFELKNSRVIKEVSIDIMNKYDYLSVDIISFQKIGN